MISNLILCRQIIQGTECPRSCHHQTVYTVNTRKLLDFIFSIWREPKSVYQRPQAHWTLFRTVIWWSYWNIQSMMFWTASASIQQVYLSRTSNVHSKLILWNLLQRVSQWLQNSVVDQCQSFLWKQQSWELLHFPVGISMYRCGAGVAHESLPSGRHSHYHNVNMLLFIIHTNIFKISEAT
jgi:hypothetical protein